MTLIISTLLYHKSLASLPFFISFDCNTIAPIAHTRELNVVLSLGPAVRTPKLQVRARILGPPHPWLWCFYGDYCCIADSLKCSAIKQPFYYGHIFCGSAVRMESNEGGFSLLREKCALRKIQKMGMTPRPGVSIIWRHLHSPHCGFRGKVGPTTNTMLLWFFLHIGRFCCIIIITEIYPHHYSKIMAVIRTTPRSCHLMY